MASGSGAAGARSGTSSRSTLKSTKHLTSCSEYSVGLRGPVCAGSGASGPPQEGDASATCWCAAAPTRPGAPAAQRNPRWKARARPRSRARRALERHALEVGRCASASAQGTLGPAARAAAAGRHGRGPGDAHLRGPLRRWSRAQELGQGQGLAGAMRCGTAPGRAVPRQGRLGSHLSPCGLLIN